MSELQAAMKIVLANTFVMYFKAHSYHWNIEGKNFSEYHEFFGDLYEELHGAVDPIAEQIRALDAYAPFGLEDLYDAKTIADDQSRVVLPQQMFSNLLQANTSLISSLDKAFELATYAKKQGLCNYLADRLDIHAKHSWMLKSYLKGI